MVEHTLGKGEVMGSSPIEGFAVTTEELQELTFTGNEALELLDATGKRSISIGVSRSAIDRIDDLGCTSVPENKGPAAS